MHSTGRIETHTHTHTHTGTAREHTCTRRWEAKDRLYAQQHTRKQRARLRGGRKGCCPRRISRMPPDTSPYPAAGSAQSRASPSPQAQPAQLCCTHTAGHACVAKYAVAAVELCTGCKPHAEKPNIHTYKTNNRQSHQAPRHNTPSTQACSGAAVGPFTHNRGPSTTHTLREPTAGHEHETSHRA